MGLVEAWRLSSLKPISSSGDRRPVHKGMAFGLQDLTTATDIDKGALPVSEQYS